MRLACLIWGLVVLAGCPGSNAGSDAGADAAVDAAIDSGYDSGATCDPPCEGTSECCASADGGVCINTRSDDNNCGRCGVVCAEGRGTHCSRGACVCGDASRGCAGTSVSMCCPPRAEGGEPYCADLEEDSTDCGGCNDQCDPTRADRCLNSGCSCGDGVELCDGTPTSMCCSDDFNVGCVDTTSTNNHCGECGRACSPTYDCIDTLCTLGPEACDGGCAEGLVCCHGVCCTEVMCEATACGT